MGDLSPELGDLSPELGNLSPELGDPSPELGYPSPELGDLSPELGDPSPELGDPSPRDEQRLPGWASQAGRMPALPASRGGLVSRGHGVHPHGRADLGALGVEALGHDVQAGFAGFLSGMASAGGRISAGSRSSSPRALMLRSERREMPAGVGRSPGRRVCYHEVMAHVDDERPPEDKISTRSAESSPDLAGRDDNDHLIRWMLSLTPTQRLEVAQGFVDSVAALRNGRRA